MHIDDDTTNNSKEKEHLVNGDNVKLTDMTKTQLFKPYNSKSLYDLSEPSLEMISIRRIPSLCKRSIMLEEVAPQETSLTDNVQDKTNWQMPLNIFTSKHRGRLKDDKMLPKSVRRYYKKQDELIAAFAGINEPSRENFDNNDASKRLRKKASILAKISFFLNLFLFFGKSVAAGLSGSLAVITSVIDSAVDLASGVLMWWSNRAMKRRDPYLYPQGRTKLEPVAIIVLSVIMALASVVMIRQSVEKIIAFVMFDVQSPELHNFTAIFCVTIPEMEEYVHMDGQRQAIFEIESIVICVSTVVIKLILFFVCRRVPTSGSQALAQDHRNDVISNTAALACGLIGYRVWKYADPIGAIIISAYIIISWYRMGKDQVKLLTGHTAQPEFLKMLTWIALNHHPKVTHIDTIRAFHFGNNFLVEVDIVLPSDMSMKESHDIGESLQCKLEKLEEVERAFVHLDYEVEHHPGSEHKVV